MPEIELFFWGCALLLIGFMFGIIFVLIIGVKAEKKRNVSGTFITRSKKS